MKKPSISLCMIVKNEERCIERCLDSIVSKVDEIIIVDTGSSDGTLELVAKYNPKIFNYVWDNHFANARNFAIDQAQCDYILQLDADEWIEDTNDELEHWLDKDIYYLPIRNILGGGLAEIHKFPRLFRRIDELRYEGALHEQINLTLNWHRTSAVLSKVIIHHDGYLQQVIDSKEKNKRNFAILIKENKDNPSAFNYYNLGQQYYSEKEYKKAVEAYKKAYLFGGEYTFTKRLLLGLIQSLMMTKQYKEALAIAHDSFELYPDYVEYKYYEGLLYLEMGYLPDAKECFEECLKIGDSNPSIHFNTYEGTGSYLAYAKLAEIAYKSMNFNEADELIRKSIKQAPTVMGFFKSFLDINNQLELSDLFEEICNLWPRVESNIQQLITTVYQLRHPVLSHFINSFTVQCDEEVASYVNTLKGNYIDAKQYWISKPEIKDGDLRDILLLSVILSDNILLDKYLKIISLRSEEKKILIAILEKTNVQYGKTTREFQQIIYDLILDLMKLQKYEYLDYFINQFTTPQMRFVIAKALYNYGFYEVSLEVLIEGTNQEEDYNNSVLAANTLRYLNQLEDSLYYYVEAYKIRREPEIAFHICELAIKLNDINCLKSILGEMMNWNIKSKWVERHLS